MKKTDTFRIEVRLSVFGAQNGYCKNCLDPIDTVNGWHHMCQNNRPNRAKFPLFLNSPMNCIGLCLHCHTNKAHKFRIKPELAEVYENWLRKFMTDMPFNV